MARMQRLYRLPGRTSLRGLRPMTEGDLQGAYKLVVGYLKKFKVSVRRAGRGNGRGRTSVWGLLRALRNRRNAVPRLRHGKPSPMRALGAGNEADRG